MRPTYLLDVVMEFKRSTILEILVCTQVLCMKNCNIPYRLSSIKKLIKWQKQFSSKELTFLWRGKTLQGTEFTVHRRIFSTSICWRYKTSILPHKLAQQEQMSSFSLHLHLAYLEPKDGCNNNLKKVTLCIYDVKWCIDKLRRRGIIEKITNLFAKVFKKLWICNRLYVVEFS